MADVWKSQPKKFCEICKCWFADNRVSIQHHENGNRHKAAVAAKLGEIGRKGRQQEKDRRQLSSTVRQMELAALQSYKRDVKDSPDLAQTYNIHQNVMGLPIKAAPPQPAIPIYPMFPEASLPDITGESERVGLDYQNANFVSIPPPDSSYGGVGPQKVWAEAKSPEGYTYYWHTVTGQTRWNPPPEGYLTEEEQQALIEVEQYNAQESTDQSAEQPANEIEPETINLGSPEAKKSETYDEIMAAVKESRAAQEKLMAFSGAVPVAGTSFTSGTSFATVAATPAPPPPPPSDILNELTQSEEERDWNEKTFAAEEKSKAAKLIAKKLEEAKWAGAVEVPVNVEVPAQAPVAEQQAPSRRPRANPYGEWTTVEKEEVSESLPQMDLGLPKGNWQEPAVPDIQIHPDEHEIVPKMKFKEKTMESVRGGKSAGGSSGMKPVQFKKRKFGTGSRIRNRDGGGDSD